MILPIYTYGQGVLKKEAEEIDESYEGLQQLIQDMFETLKKAEGVGLAAPQVGLPIRLAVVDLDVISDDQPEFKGYFRTYINPYIEETDGAMIPYEEGCLSFPGWVIHHFRTASEMYMEIPRSEALRRFRIVRSQLPQTAFFANGDILTPADAEGYRNGCGCDGIAVGRGILRNPFLLRAILTGREPDSDLRSDFLSRLTTGIANRRRHHFQLECVKMAYGEDSDEFRNALESVQRHKTAPG